MMRHRFKLIITRAAKAIVSVSVSVSAAATAILLATPQALARTKIDVSAFTNKTEAGSCNAVAHWKGGIDDAFKHQLINSLNSTGNFTLVEAELMRGEERAKLFDSGVSTIHKSSTFKAAKYSVYGALKKFDICDKAATVVLELKVVENATGKMVQNFESKGQAPNIQSKWDYKGAPFNTGLFKDSPIGQATTTAVADATAKLKRAFPSRDLASGEYKIRTIPRSRGR